MFVQKGVFFFFLAEKKVKVIPVYKSDDENDFGNYWLISLLSIFSRMYHRLRAYNHEQKLLTHENYQHFSFVLSPVVKSSLPFPFFQYWKHANNMCLLDVTAATLEE